MCFCALLYFPLFPVLSSLIWSGLVQPLSVLKRFTSSDSVLFMSLALIVQHSFQHCTVGTAVAPSISAVSFFPSALVSNVPPEVCILHKLGLRSSERSVITKGSDGV